MKWKFLASICATCITSTVYGAAHNEKVSPKAYVLLDLWGLPITNSMVTALLFSIGLIVAVRLITGSKLQLIPTRAQLAIEVILEGLRDTLQPVVGSKVAPHAFPLLLSFFLYILIQNWGSLLPGMGTIGTYDASGHLIYFFRPMNADLNATLGLSIVGLAAWAYFVIRYEGLKHFAFELFGNKADKSELPKIIYLFLFVIFFGVGLIEVISIVFRLVSLSFRLYGNVFGGENLIGSIHAIYRYILPVPFYFLEALIGGVQAFVFTLLIAVYIGLVCNHETENKEFLENLPVK